MPDSAASAAAIALVGSAELITFSAAGWKNDSIVSSTMSRRPTTCQTG